MSLRISFRHAYPDADFDIAIDAPTPGVTVLFGSSGAGKSTVANVAAGLIRPRHATVAVDADILEDTGTGIFLPPERRRIATVFQDARLFPHLNVTANLRYGLARTKAPIRTGFDEVVALLGIEHLLTRAPASLSGGERQRVAIGRALLSQPRLLIMDEPLASLDTSRRAEILPYLARLRNTQSLPILYVTHALDEVARLADTLILLAAGRIVAAGPVAEIVARADLPHAADDPGAVLAATVTAHVPDRSLSTLILAAAPGIELVVPLQPVPTGTPVRIRIQAGDIILARHAPVAISIHNILPARIEAIALGQDALVQLRLGDAPLLARVTPDAVRQLELAPGAEITILVKSIAIQVLRA